MSCRLLRTVTHRSSLRYKSHIMFIKRAKTTNDDDDDKPNSHTIVTVKYFLSSYLAYVHTHTFLLHKNLQHKILLSSERYTRLTNLLLGLFCKINTQTFLLSFILFYFSPSTTNMSTEHIDISQTNEKKSFISSSLETHL